MPGKPPPVPGGRSDEERERARLEREARRKGTPLPPPPKPPDDFGWGDEEPLPQKKQRREKQPKQPKPSKQPRASSGSHRRIAELREQRRARPPRERRPGDHGGGGKVGRYFLVAAVVLALFAGWFLNSLFQPFAGEGGKPVTVTIPKEAGLDEIATVLADKGVVDSEFFFKLRATITGKRSDLKPGTYTLPTDAGYPDVLDTLAKGPPDDSINVTIPEGRSRGEINESIAESGLDGDYEKATKKSDELNPKRYGARNAKDLEGFLFPASYELKRGQPVDALVEKQLSTFKREFRGVSMRRAKTKNLSPYDVLIIASLVERETAVPRERKLIASVIYNRLSQGTPLGIDATTRFETGNWDEPIKNSDLQKNTPYNTRLRKGLPPGPIGNPGIASIKAAANPGTSPYLFYVANPCKPGSHTFTRTLEEFNSEVAKYNRAREAAGGKAPKGC
jgi:uncharacterized YceG family protein